MTEDATPDRVAVDEWERGMTCPDCRQYGDGCRCGDTGTLIDPEPSR